MVLVRRAAAADADDIAAVHIAAFKAAYPTLRLVHTDDEVRRWIREHVVPETECWVAAEGPTVVAMMSLTPGWVDQLYVDPHRQGEGIGRQLLELAKSRAEADLDLWTFQVNAPARRFYGRNGFVEVELTDGEGNEEREPDVRLRWRSGESHSG
jgi:GNAT superfamily N-acetyltransferase